MPKHGMSHSDKNNGRFRDVCENDTPPPARSGRLRESGVQTSVGEGQRRDIECGGATAGDLEQERQLLNKNPLGTHILRTRLIHLLVVCSSTWVMAGRGCSMGVRNSGSPAQGVCWSPGVLEVGCEGFGLLAG